MARRSAAGSGLRWCRTFASPVRRRASSANFTRLGFHPGFGLTETLPAVIGKQNAAMMFYTSRRVTGEEALAMGLADVLVPQDQVRAAAQKLAAEIAENAPLGVTRDARHHARRPCRSRHERDRARAGDRRRACARRKTSRKASRRWPSAACRISRGGEFARLIRKPRAAIRIHNHDRCDIARMDAWVPRSRWLGRDAADPVSASCLIKSAIRSATMMVEMLVLAHGIDGITEASQTRKPVDAAHAARGRRHRERIAVAAHAAAPDRMPHARDRSSSDRHRASRRRRARRRA